MRYIARELPFSLLSCVLLIVTAPTETLSMDKEDMSKECYDLLHDEEQIGTPEHDNCLASINREPTTLVITPMFRTQDIKKAPASVAVVPSDVIQRSTADSLAELVRDVPGIEVTDAGQVGLKRIRVRGEESRRVSILIDGQEFADEREVGTPVLIAPEMIERIEVLRGTSSVLHGSRGIGGVVNIITKKGGYHPLQGSASTSFDTATDGFQHFISAYGTTQGFDYRAAYTNSDHKDRETARGTLEDTEYENDSYSFYLSKELGAHTFAASYDDYNASSQVYVDPVVATTPPFLDFRIDAPKRDRSKAALFYDWSTSTGSLKQVHADAYFQRSEREFNTFSILELDLGQGAIIRNSDVFNDSTTDTVGTNLRAELGFGEHTVVTGLKATTSSLDQERRRELTEANVRSDDEVVEDEATQDGLELFTQDEWQFLEDWSVIAGARGYWYRSELERTTRQGLSPDSRTDTSAVASLGLKHSFSDSTTIWSTWSQGYVVPTLINSTTGAFAGPDFVSPNMDLEPERSNSIDIGLRHAMNELSFEVSAFYTRARDYIEHVSCSATETQCIEPAVGRRDRVYVNISKAQTYGAELATSYELMSALTPYTSLSWIRRSFESDSIDTYDTGLPTFSTRFGIRGTHTFSNQLLSWYDLYGRAATEATESISGNEAIETAGWATTNLSLGVALLKKQNVKLILDVLNIGDNDYTNATENIPARGRSAIVKISADI